ncbi:sodium-independent sulfate anion transporter-like [Culicoides brevitarsis]|uniref:sodium-independent sulfate anion transporter-like n=1 Tax=Culicoides brevitarsis TaxID=469753 RepID=UPI00307C2319
MDPKKTLSVPDLGTYSLHGVSHSSLNIAKEIPGFRGSNDFILTETRRVSIIDTAKDTGHWCQRKYRQIFRKKMLYKRMPILNWLPKYSMEDAIGDLIAGLTVGLTIIPQALAYSGIAGLDPQYGLYGSFLGSFIYIIFGSDKNIPMGPTAIASLLTFQIARGSWQKAVLLCFLSGFVELFMGILGLGFLIDFVSGPVGSGFTSAVSLIILTSQVKDLFGIRAKGNTFVEIWISIFKDIHNIRVGDTVMGCSCIVILLLMRKFSSIKFGPEDDNEKSWYHKVLNKIFWLIATARNAIIVVVTGLISHALIQNGYKGSLKIIGDIPSGLPTFQAPPFSIDEVKNETGHVIQEYESFFDMISFLGSGIIVIPLIALLENMAICKAFANGKPIDATQELIAIGLANIANSFCLGYPGNGALSRGAVNNASGVRTPFGSFYTGVLVILALLFFTPYFTFIPKAALGAVIIAAVIFMIEFNVITPMWKSKRSDLIPGISCFLACLILPLEIGILLGIGVNVIFVLYHAARPKIHMEKRCTPKATKYLLITPDRCLIFPSVDYVRNLINKQGIKLQTPVVIDCTHIYGADYTAAKAIEMLLQDFESRNQPIYFLNLKPSVANVFEGAELDFHVFYTYEILENAIDLCKYRRESRVV